MVLSERGLLNHWAKKVAARSPKNFLFQQCSNRHIDRPKNSRVSFQSLTGAFVILGIGIGVSLFTFLLEISCSYRNTRKARGQKDRMS